MRSSAFKWAPGLGTGRQRALISAWHRVCNDCFNYHSDTVYEMWGERARRASALSIPASKAVHFIESLDIIYTVLARHSKATLTVTGYLSHLSWTLIVEDIILSEYLLGTYVCILPQTPSWTPISIWHCVWQACVLNAANRRGNQFVILHIIAAGSWPPLHKLNISLEFSF